VSKAEDDTALRWRDSRHAYPAMICPYSSRAPDRTLPTEINLSTSGNILKTQKNQSAHELIWW
jgi:hypothetical protein